MTAIDASAVPDELVAAVQAHRGLAGIFAEQAIREELAIVLEIAIPAIVGVEVARIAALLDRCDREDAHNPPRLRYLYTLEIRRLLGVASRPSAPVREIESNGS